MANRGSPPNLLVLGVLARVARKLPAAVRWCCEIGGALAETGWPEQLPYHASSTRG